MLPEYLQRGVAAGAVGGVAYGLYMAAVANPFVASLEEAAHQGHEHGQEHAVAELTTVGASIGSGVLWGILLGGVFGLAYYVFEPALPGRGAGKALVLAGAGFLSVSGVPWLVLPPATPDVEYALGTEVRIALYAGLMIVGAAVATASILGYKRIRPRGRTLAVAVAALPLATVAVALPIGAPTVVSGSTLQAPIAVAFRGVVVLSSAGLWAIIAGSYHWLQTRTTTAQRHPAEESAAIDP